MVGRGASAPGAIRKRTVHGYDGLTADGAGLRWRRGHPHTRCTDTKEHSMTDTNEAVITEALAVIDKALAEMLRRELVSSGAVADLLLDVRTLLPHPAAVASATS